MPVRSTPQAPSVAFCCAWAFCCSTEDAKAATVKAPMRIAIDLIAPIIFTGSRRTPSRPVHGGSALFRLNDGALSKQSGQFNRGTHGRRPDGEAGAWCRRALDGRQSAGMVWLQPVVADAR